MTRLHRDFFQQDVLTVARALIGAELVFQNQSVRIVETEAYRGEEDLACHASKGKTGRTTPLYEAGGIAYVYLIYGIHELLNIVTGPKDHPQAVLLRAAENIEDPFDRSMSGPGKLTRHLGINRSFNGKSVTGSELYLRENTEKRKVQTSKRIGVEYAGPIWANKAWRFFDAQSRAVS